MRITATKLIENAIANYERDVWMFLPEAMTGNGGTLPFTDIERAIIQAACDATYATPDRDYCRWADASREEKVEALRLALAIVKKREARR